MKSTGIVRPVDQLGRVVIPKELRRTMNITNDTPMEVYTDGDTIILKKYAPGCSICGRSDKYMRGIRRAAVLRKPLGTVKDGSQRNNKKRPLRKRRIKNNL